MSAPPDQHVRALIGTDLDTNLLVEAGAGSGKTTALVGRMLALVKSGVPVERIAAVTFTRKAAAELRERFQARIESELRDADADSPTAERLALAVRDAERGFVGTVHAFCARLLRERPLEAGIDPAFEEMMEAEHDRYLTEFWRVELDRRTANDDPLLMAVLEAGLHPGELAPVFPTLVENLDVDFPVQDAPPPSSEAVAPVRIGLEKLVARGVDLLPTEKPERGWGKLQQRIRDLTYLRGRRDWDTDIGFLNALADLIGWKPEVAQYKWGRDSTTKAAAKQLKESFETFLEDPEVLSVGEQWLARRYAPAMRFLLSMAQAFAAERRRTGRLSFQDLLSLTAELLRTHPSARRDLGRRYSRLLIDEFQDTDPIQAEIAFLLASDPTPAEGDPAQWTLAKPRPGALFMVGDPKQSIYRFRRADISVYNTVRERMERDGRVVRLLANFRSLRSIASLVNDVFGEHFPPEPTTEQAAYAPLLAQRGEDGVPTHGVFAYVLPKSRFFGTNEARDEAERLASWINRRVDAGERRPGDFLILTDRKRHLHLYAHALEARHVPVDVAGARVEVDRGLGELLVVLQALVDPANPVPTVAVLTGLFFGLDHDQLLDHRVAGGGFDCRTAAEGPEGPVKDGLERIAGWWRRSLKAPSDVFVGQLVDELGVIPDAAASELGGIRTGALLYALDTVRTAAVGGDTSLVGAVEALRTGIQWSDAETPLEPGRVDAVRVMNVHKAKGLEAPVVVLAGPGGEWASKADLHVAREEDGRAVGHLEIGIGLWGRRVIARPLGWREFEATETSYLDAQQVRLRYVAATRAAEELVVGTRERGNDSPWRLVEPWVAEHATALEAFEIEPVSPGSAPEATPETIRREVGAANSRRLRLGEPSYVVETVTSLAKSRPGHPEEGVEAPAVMPEYEGPRGFEWGSVVHAALAAVARGLPPDRRNSYFRALLVEQGRAVDGEGRPTELDDLVRMIDAVTDSAIWARAQEAATVLVEAPFATPVDNDPDHIIEGVVDLAFRGDDGWVLVDYKTDVGDDEGFAGRVQGYRAQVELYGRAWALLTGEAVAEKVLLFTAQGREERW